MTGFGPTKRNFREKEKKKKKKAHCEVCWVMEQEQAGLCGLPRVGQLGVRATAGAVRVHRRWLCEIPAAPRTGKTHSKHFNTCYFLNTTYSIFIVSFIVQNVHVIGDVMLDLLYMIRR